MAVMNWRGMLLSLYGRDKIQTSKIAACREILVETCRHSAPLHNHDVESYRLSIRGVVDCKAAEKSRRKSGFEAVLG